MERFGSDEAGFSIDLRGSVVLVRVWGFWAADLAAEFAPAVLAACRAASRPLRILLDGARLKPQNDAGEQAFRALFTSISQSGLTHAALVVTNTLTKMQLKRITKQLSTCHWVYVATSEVDPDRLPAEDKQEDWK